jgi:radial spoke head protein 4A
LAAPVACWPKFPGNEASYVRAQIARISHATAVSPKGLYAPVDIDEDDDQRAAEQLEVVETEDWSGLQPAALLDPRCWVHHSPALLNQGRCTFWRAPKVKPAPPEGASEDDEDEGVETQEDADVDAADETPAEVGPAVLTSIAEDTPIAGDAGTAAWTVSRVHGVPGKGGCVVASSNRWPGAHAAAYGPRFSNLYVGFGLKATSEPWTPTIPVPPVIEYAGPVVAAELDDPTLEQEQAEADARRKEEEDCAKAEAEKAEEARRKKEEADAAKKGDTGGAADAKQTADPATTASEFEDDEDEEEEEDEDK